MTMVDGVYCADWCNGYQHDKTVKGFPGKIKKVEFGQRVRWPGLENALPNVPGQPGVTRGPLEPMECVDRCKITLKDGTVSKEVALKVFDAYAIYKLAGSKRVEGPTSLVQLEDHIRKTDNRYALNSDEAIARQAIAVYTHLFPEHFEDKKINITITM